MVLRCRKRGGDHQGMEVVLLVAPDVVVQTSEEKSYSSEEVGRTTGDVHRRGLGPSGDESTRAQKQ